MSLSVNNVSINTNTNNVSFKGRNWKKEYDLLMKALKTAKNDAERLDIKSKLEKLSKDANSAVEQRIKNSSFETKVDNATEGVFTWLVKTANMLTKKITDKLDKGETVDMAKKVTSIVLIGNTLKEVVGTALYTTQAMTNEDLPKEKRGFVGMYDLFVGIVSSIISLIFGVGLQNSINKGYNKLFKPLKSMPQIGLISVALAGFTSFALQTILGKRIIAPALATPFAGRVKTSMMERAEAQKKVQNNEQKKVMLAKA